MAAANTTSTPVLANNGLMNVGIYSIICVIYLIMDTNSELKPRDKTSFFAIFKPMALIFLTVIWLTQFSLTFMALKKQCNSPNYGLAAWASMLTFILLFVPHFVFLEFDYTWLRPFSNTIGHLINKLSGLTSFLQRIMRTKSDSDKIQKYLDYVNDDSWALFSMLTVSDYAPDSINASKKFDDLEKSGYLNTPLIPDAKSTFVNFVRVKENIAKFIFYVLTLNLMADITFIISQENSPCAINVKQTNEVGSTSLQEKPTTPPIVFKTSE
jgi:hypothetical protein